MIPSIEIIVDDLDEGKITKSQAIAWLHEHASGAANELRDYFAGQAMTGFNKGMVDYGWGQDTLDGHAMSAYAIADAMLKARNQ